MEQQGAVRTGDGMNEFVRCSHRTCVEQAVVSVAVHWAGDAAALLRAAMLCAAQCPGLQVHQSAVGPKHGAPACHAKNQIEPE